jgi:hypothetical protein
MVSAQVPAVAAPAPAPDSGRKLSLIAASAAGRNAEAQFANFATSSDFASAAQFILSTQGSTLTGFQKSVLSLAPYIAQDGGAIRDRITGVKLSVADRIVLIRLLLKFESNPAIRVLIRTGEHFKFSPSLASTISGDTTVLTTPLTVIPPGSGIPQLDDFDNAVGNYATAANLAALTPAMTTVMQSRDFPNFVRRAPPLVADSLIPADQTWKLLLPNDHDPTTKEYVDFIGGVLIATIIGIGAILAIPEELAAALILTTVGTIMLQGLVTYDFLTTLDCDHDGDPWDPDENGECPPGNSQP